MLIQDFTISYVNNSGYKNYSTVEEMPPYYTILCHYIRGILKRFLVGFEIVLSLRQGFFYDKLMVFMVQ